MRVKHKVIFLKGKISLGKKKLGKIDIFFSVKKLLCLLYKVAWKGWKSWWLYPESPYYQKHQERGEKLLEFRRKLHIDLNESLLLVVFHVSWCICLWRSFFPNNFPTLCLFFWLNITLEQLVTQLVYKCFHTRRPDITAFLWSSSGEAFELSRLFAQSTLHLCDCSESLNYIASQPHTLRVLDSSRAALWHHFCHKFYVQFLNTTMEWRVRCLITLGWCGQADGCLGLPYQTCVGGRGWMMDGWDWTFECRFYYKVLLNI